MTDLENLCSDCLNPNCRPVQSRQQSVNSIEIMLVIASCRSIWYKLFPRLPYLDNKHGALLAKIVEEKAIKEDTKASVKSALDEFKAVFKPTEA